MQAAPEQMALLGKTATPALPATVRLVQLAETATQAQPGKMATPAPWVALTFNTLPSFLETRLIQKVLWLDKFVRLWQLLNADDMQQEHRCTETHTWAYVSPPLTWGFLNMVL